MKVQSASATVDDFPGNVGKRDNAMDERDNNLYAQSGGAKPITPNLKSRKGINKENGYPLSSAALAGRISGYLFEYLEGFHIPTHYLHRVSDTDVAVRDLVQIPVAVKVYNFPTPALATRLPLKEGYALEFPIVEHYYRDPAAGLAWVNEHHLAALGVLSLEEFKQINRLASKVNAVLRGFCDRRRLILAEVCLEFGREGTCIRLGGELSPATCVFHDASADAAQKNYFNDETVDPAERYGRLLDRLLLKV